MSRVGSSLPAWSVVVFKAAFNIAHAAEPGRNPSLRSGSWRGWTASRGLRLPRDKTRLKSTIPRATPPATHTVTRIANSDLVVNHTPYHCVSYVHVFRHWRTICRRINAGVEIGSRNAPSVFEYTIAFSWKRIGLRVSTRFTKNKRFLVRDWTDCENIAP